MLHIIFFSMIGVVLSNNPSANLRDPVLFCDGCYAVVSELQQDMVASKGEKLEARIDQGLAGVCSTEKLRAYKFSPPTQVKTCLAILDKYQLMLRSVLKEGFRGGREATVDQMMEQFCQKGTKACKNREVPTLQQKREREEAKVKAEGKLGEKVNYRREWTAGQGAKPEL